MLSNPGLVKAVKRAAFFAALLALYMIAAKLVTGHTCFFEAVAGIPCPGCGLSRAFLVAFRLDIRGAFAYHPLFWYIPVIAGVCIYKYARYGQKRNVLYDRFVLFSLILFTAVYIIRMILYFPHTPPFVINPNSIIQRPVRFLIELLRYS